MTGDLLIFKPRSVDRMHLPTVKHHCAEKLAVEFGDQLGAVKLWPGERLRVRCELSQEALLCDFTRHLVLVFKADTQPAPSEA